MEQVSVPKRTIPKNTNSVKAEKKNVGKEENDTEIEDTFVIFKQPKCLVSGKRRPCSTKGFVSTDEKQRNWGRLP